MRILYCFPVISLGEESNVPEITNKEFNNFKRAVWRRTTNGLEIMSDDSQQYFFRMLKILHQASTAVIQRGAFRITLGPTTWTNVGTLESNCPTRRQFDC